MYLRVISGADSARIYHWGSGTERVLTTTDRTVPQVLLVTLEGTTLYCTSAYEEVSFTETAFSPSGMDKLIIEGGYNAPIPCNINAGLAWNRALSAAERRYLVLNPEIIFPRVRRIPIPTASAAASTYTLSAATYAPGSLTATGVTPRVTVTVA
jgi:hypothetical protein